MPGSKPQVVIVGGGFGGLAAARALRRAPVEVTLVDRRNFHLFQPLLYQVATGGLSPANIAAPLRFLLRRQRNARVLLDEVTGFDAGGRRVLLADRALAYDFLVVAAGARTSYFGHDDWAAHAPGIKDVEDAREIRRRVFTAFERAELAAADEQEAWLTFVVIGGGPTGVELAGAVAEVARETLPRDFRRVDTREARIVLLEGGERILPAMSPELSRRAEASLRRLGVEVRTGCMVEDVAADRVTFRAAEAERSIAARTTLWAAGVAASPLGRALAAGTGAELDRGGRLLVEPDCTLAGHPELFVIGDLARWAGEDGAPLPGIAPVAMQQGRHAGQSIARRVAGDARPLPFRYRDKGELATIGRRAAVAKIGGREFSGLSAWLTWLFVHLMYLAAFENRLLVLLQWGWNYATWNRSARLITPAREREEG